MDSRDLCRRLIRVCSTLCATLVVLLGAIQYAPIAFAADSTDLEITQTAAPSPVATGSELTWTIVVTNLGPNTGINVAVNDNFNEFGTTTEFVSLSTTQGTCTHDASTFYCTIGDVANGATVTITLVVTVLSNTSVVNVADVQAANDNNYGNNHVTDTITVGTAADLQLTKTAAPTSAAPGDTVTFTLVARNAGPSSASSVQLVDLLPEGLQNPTVSPADECSITGTEVSCSIGTLANGDSFTAVVTATISPTFSDAGLTNTATVTTTTIDSDLTNNSATVTVDVSAPSADLAVTKTLTTDPLVAGAPVRYTLAVENHGPAEATDATLSDQLPASLSNVSVTSDLGTCTEAAGLVTCDFGTIPAGASSTVTVTAELATSATGELANTAHITSDTPDPNTANNSSTATATIRTSADLSITKTGSTTTAGNGDSVDYTIQVTNLGPSDAADAVVTDPLPSDLAYTAGSCTTPVGNCDYADGELTFSLGTLTPGQTVTLGYTAVVSEIAPDEQLVNTASVTHDGTDPVTSNNEASYTLNIDAAADVSVTKTATPVPAVAGGTVSFTLRVHNTGPGTSENLELSDDVPSVVDVTSVTPSAGDCSSGTSNAVRCTLDELAEGADWTVTIVGTLDAATPAGTIANTATVTAEDDPTASNNRATVIVPTVARADLTLTKTAPATVTAGDQLTYSLRLTNAGPSAATSTTVVDILPPGTTFVSASDADCTPQAAAPRVVVCTLGTVAPDASQTFSITVRVDQQTPDGTVLVNRAQASSEVPGVSDELIATASTTVETSADLRTTKLVAPDVLVAGAPATYVIRVRNQGPSTARQVSVDDTVPASLSIDSVSPAGGTCTATDQDIRCDRDTLSAGASWSIVVHVTVADDATGSVTNEAVATSDTTDPNPDDNTGTATADIQSSADVQMVKTTLFPALDVGQTAVFFLTAVNNGPSAAVSVTVTDTFPAGLSPVSASGGCSVSGQDVTCAYDSIPAGGTRTSLVIATVDADASGTLTNSATADSSTFDPTTGNNTSTAHVTVSPTPSVTPSPTITASPSPSASSTATASPSASPSSTATTSTSTAPTSTASTSTASPSASSTQLAETGSTRLMTVALVVGLLTLGTGALLLIAGRTNRHPGRRS